MAQLPGLDCYGVFDQFVEASGVMGGHHQRGAGFARCLERSKQCDPSELVESGKRFVEDQQMRPTSEEPRERDAPLLSSTQLVNASVAIQPRGQAQRGQGLVRGVATHSGGVPHVLSHGSPQELEPRMLQREQRPTATVPHRPSIEQNLSLGRCAEPGQD